MSIIENEIYVTYADALAIKAGYCGGLIIYLTKQPNTPTAKLEALNTHFDELLTGLLTENAEEKCQEGAMELGFNLHRALHRTPDCALVDSAKPHLERIIQLVNDCLDDKQTRFIDFTYLFESFDAATIH